MPGENGEGVGITPFHPEGQVQTTPFPPASEAVAVLDQIPDFVPDPPEFAKKETSPGLDTLATRYQQTIDRQASHFSFSDKTKDALENVVDFAKEHKYKLVIPVLAIPIILQQIAEGYPAPVALVKGIDEMMRGDPNSHMDPEQAIEIVRSISNVDMHDFARLAVGQLIELGDDYRAAFYEAIILTLVLSGMEKAKNSKKEKKESIERGTAKVKPRGEQIFVLGGKGGSYISEALKKNNPKGVTAIFENEKEGSSIASLLPREAHKLHSLFLNLGIDENHPTYSGAPGWDKLSLKDNNLIHTSDGRNVLCVVGIDAANEDEWLGIPEHNHDLTLDEHFTSVLKLQEKVDTKNMETCGIWVGAADRKEIDEETGDLTKTNREAALNNGIDIYIDTWSVVVKNIERAIQEDIDKQICEFPCGVRLISDMEDYHERFDDVAQALSLPLIKRDEDKEDKAILIVYEETSDKTLHTAQRKMKQFPGRKIIAITSNLGAHKNALEHGIESVCLADVLAKEVRTVRSEIKSGMPYHEIQNRLDSAYRLHAAENEGISKSSVEYT